MADERGQGTAEYAVVLAAVLCIVVALGAFWNLLSAGTLVEHALAAASHHVQAAAGWAVDVFSY